MACRCRSYPTSDASSAQTEHQELDFEKKAIAHEVKLCFSDCISDAFPRIDQDSQEIAAVIARGGIYLLHKLKLHGL
jgi:hypothetical protein